jgi:hypothetical protein
MPYNAWMLQFHFTLFNILINSYYTWHIVHIETKGSDDGDVQLQCGNRDHRAVTCSCLKPLVLSTLLVTLSLSTLREELELHLFLALQTSHLSMSELCFVGINSAPHIDSPLGGLLLSDAAPGAVGCQWFDWAHHRDVSYGGTEIAAPLLTYILRRHDHWLSGNWSELCGDTRFLGYADPSHYAIPTHARCSLVHMFILNCVHVALPKLKSNAILTQFRFLVEMNRRFGGPYCLHVLAPCVS